MKFYDKDLKIEMMVTSIKDEVVIKNVPKYFYVNEVFSDEEILAYVAENFDIETIKEAKNGK